MYLIILQNKHQILFKYHYSAICQLWNIFHGPLFSCFDNKRQIWSNQDQINVLVLVTEQ